MRDHVFTRRVARDRDGVTSFPQLFDAQLEKV